MGAPDVRAADGRVRRTSRTRSRTCCASWRRRSSARSPAGSATSTPPRTRCRRRCWRPPRHWPRDGVPDNPRGWLIQTALARLTRPAPQRAGPAAPGGAWPRRGSRRRPSVPGGSDDTLTLLFLCCHPALTPASAIALTLRAVGGLTTAEIARAFLVPEATMAQRISRAKQRIRASGVPFRMPAPAERGRPAALGAARALPDLQRGLRQQRRRRRCTAPSCPTRRSGWPGWCTGCCPTTPRSPACSR